jgi:hypothetical protein
MGILTFCNWLGTSRPHPHFHTTVFLFSHIVFQCPSVYHNYHLQKSTPVHVKYFYLFRFMDLKNMSEQLVKENYHARAQVETREKQIMARWQVSPLLVLFLSQVINSSLSNSSK